MSKNNIRYFTCFNCKVYMPIYPDNPINQKELELFKTYHQKHMTQTVNWGEIPVDYVCEIKTIKDNM